MRIEFARSGGFAGILLTARVDLQDLPPAEAAVLQAQVEAAGFFELPAQLRPASTTPDRFEYQLTVVAADKTHTVTVSEPMVTDVLRPLLDHLTALARTGKYR